MLSTVFPPKPRPCKQCGNPFVPVRPMQAVCGPRCAAKKVKADRAQERAQIRTRKEAIKTRGELIAEAQAVVNRYVRLRDAGKGCISCGAKPENKFGGSMDAGHFRSVGSAPHMRFYLPQIAAQCVKCNRYLGGNAVEFRRGLVERLGLSRVEEIESMQFDAKWSMDYLRKLRVVIGKRAKRLEKRKEMRK